MLKTKRNLILLGISMIFILQMILSTNVRADSTQNGTISKNCFYPSYLGYCPEGTEIRIICDTPFKFILMDYDVWYVISGTANQNLCDLSWIYGNSYSFVQREITYDNVQQCYITIPTSDSYELILIYNTTDSHTVATYSITITEPIENNSNDITWLLFIIAGVIIGIIYAVMRKKDIQFQRKTIPKTIILVMVVPTIKEFIVHDSTLFVNFWVLLISIITSSIWLIIEMIKERKSMSESSWQTTKPISSDDGWSSSSTHTHRSSEPKDKKSLLDIISAIAGIIGTIISFIELIK